MKEYPLTDSDIETLGLTKGGAAVCFSISTFLLGFIGNKLDPSTWESAMQSLSSPAYSFALGAAVTIFLVGIWLWVRNGSTIRRIKNEVKFDN
jgi:hypothetical protein